MLHNKLSENICCPYYLTLKIMSKPRVLLSNWNLRNFKNLSRLFCFVFSFKIAINEKGETTTISMMTIMKMISLFYRPRSHSGLFYQRNLQSQGTLYLPMQLTPKYSGPVQIHRKDPSMLLHMELLSQLFFFLFYTRQFLQNRRRDYLVYPFLNSRFCPQKDYSETVSNHSSDHRRNWFQSECYYHYQLLF